MQFRGKQQVLLFHANAISQQNTTKWADVNIKFLLGGFVIVVHVVDDYDGLYDKCVFSGLVRGCTIPKNAIVLQTVIMFFSDLYMLAWAMRAMPHEVSGAACLVELPKLLH